MALVSFQHLYTIYLGNLMCLILSFHFIQIFFRNYFDQFRILYWVLYNLILHMQLIQYIICVQFHISTRFRYSLDRFFIILIMFQKSEYFISNIYTVFQFIQCINQIQFHFFHTIQILFRHFLDEIFIDLRKSNIQFVQ